MYKLILFYLFACFLIISCGSPTGPSIDNNLLDGVPSGEIVPVEEREATLTGLTMSKSTESSASESQKWWNHVVTKIDVQNCEGYEDMEESYDDYYFAFKPEGKLYFKVGADGTEYEATTWEWSDGSKSGIVLGDYPDVEFEFTMLNENEVVYASVQQEGSCRAVTWEHFKNQ